MVLKMRHDEATLTDQRALVVQRLNELKRNQSEAQAKGEKAQERALEAQKLSNEAKVTLETAGDRCVHSQRY